MSDQPAQDATEAPTPRRLARAREEGQIAHSGELTAAATVLSGLLVLAVGGSALAHELVRITRTRLGAAAQADLHGALGGLLSDILRTSMPVVGATFVCALVVGGLQAGGLFTFAPLAPRLDKLSPAAGLARMFSAEALVTVLKALAKLAVIAGVATLTLAPAVRVLPNLPGTAADRAAAFTWALVIKLALRVALAYAVLGAADYLWQRHRHHRRLRMTREQVKQEHKEQEGDPQHKAERRRLHQELLRHAMIEAVRQADCVVVNPAHIAVALRWDQASMAAPEVVAKGHDLVAAEIREVARQFGVPIYRDVPLARALDGLELGDQIPESLYEAVAEVLRFIAASGEA
jgi:flagellar biosynthesis protein FlhB